MATNNNSNVICLVNGLLRVTPPPEKRKPEEYRSAVLYYENQNLETFKHGEVNTEHWYYPEPDRKGYVIWEGEDRKGRIWDATFKSLPEVRFRIAIFPEDKDEPVSGVAYAKGDPTKPTPKVFRIYPGKRRDSTRKLLFLDKDDLYDYWCVYYGTEDDRQVEALIDGPKKIPDAVPWKSLEAEVARLKKENGVLTTDKSELERQNGVLTTDKSELERQNGVLTTEKDRLEREKNRLQAKDDRLQAAVKAVVKVVVDAVEDLKNDDKNKVPNADKGAPNTDKNGIPNTGGSGAPNTDGSGAPNTDKNGAPNTNTNEIPKTGGE